jgi:hypothetical protein
MSMLGVVVLRLIVAYRRDRPPSKGVDWRTGTKLSKPKAGESILDRYSKDLRMLQAMAILKSHLESHSGGKIRSMHAKAV